MHLGDQASKRWVHKTIGARAMTPGSIESPELSTNMPTDTHSPESCDSPCRNVGCYTRAHARTRLWRAVEPAVSPERCPASRRLNAVDDKHE